MDAEQEEISCIPTAEAGVHCLIELAHLPDVLCKFCLCLVGNRGVSSSGLLVMDPSKVGRSCCCICETDLVGEDVDARRALRGLSASIVCLG